MAYAVGWGQPGVMPDPTGASFNNLVGPGGAPLSTPDLMSALYQDYLGRAPDPGGLQNALNAYNAGAGNTSGPMGGGLTGGLFSVGNMLFNSPEGQQYAQKMWGQPPAGAGGTVPAMSLIGNVPGQATPQAMSAVQSLGVPVNNMTGAPIDPQSYVQTPANQPNGSMSGGSGFDPMSTFTSILNSLKPAGGPAPGAPVTPITGGGFMNPQSMSPYNIPPSPGIPQTGVGDRNAGPSPVTAQGLSSGLPLGYLTARAGGS